MTVLCTFYNSLFAVAPNLSDSIIIDGIATQKTKPSVNLTLTGKLMFQERFSTYCGALCL